MRRLGYPLCFNDYFPGYFPLDEPSRSLTITSHISLFNSFPDPLSPLFVSIDLPDGLTLGFVPPVENPLPAALPLFATGLGALGLLGWRRKRKRMEDE